MTAKQSVTIHARKSKVWEALTNPVLIRQYFFGTETITDWKVGSPIIYRGEWQGKPYKDKGTILAIEHERLIKYNYWSSFSGTPDTPENYSDITYTINESNGYTTLDVIQEGIADEERRKHSEANWKLVMEGMKKLLEDER